MNDADDPGGGLAAFRNRLGLEDCDPPQLQTALTHRSFSFESDDTPNNERLEFLGDAVLGLVVTDMIYKWYPDLPEGDLAKLRSGTVNTSVLAVVAREVSLGGVLRLGKGEELSGGRNKDSILADAMEAVLGAVYQDCGLADVRLLIDRLFTPHIREFFGRGVLRDYKTSLQEAAVQKAAATPDYRVSAHGPDHAKRFRAEVYLNDDLLGRGEGRSKKQAEQAAAKQALDALGNGPDGARAS